MAGKERTVRFLFLQQQLDNLVLKLSVEYTHPIPCRLYLIFASSFVFKVKFKMTFQLLLTGPSLRIYSENIIQKILLKILCYPPPSPKKKGKKEK